MIILHYNIIGSLFFFRLRKLNIRLAVLVAAANPMEIPKLSVEVFIGKSSKSMEVFSRAMVD